MVKTCEKSFGAAILLYFKAPHFITIRRASVINILLLQHGSCEKKFLDSMRGGGGEEGFLAFF
jgi:hypothetical protein